jgi:hypothetical protein
MKLSVTVEPVRYDRLVSVVIRGAPHVETEVNFGFGLTEILFDLKFHLRVE